MRSPSRLAHAPSDLIAAAADAITNWVADVSSAVPAGLHLRSGATAARPLPKSTIWRVLTDAGTEAFDTPGHCADGSRRVHHAGHGLSRRYYSESIVEVSHRFAQLLWR
jgi:hypothetical protein